MSPSGPTRAALPGTRPTGASDEASASRQVREMFSRIAPRYDLLNHLLSLRFDVMWRKRVARRFRDVLARPDARVLDLCCGTGDLAFALAAQSHNQSKSGAARIAGADFAHPMLVRACEKSRMPSGHGHCRILGSRRAQSALRGPNFRPGHHSLRLPQPSKLRCRPDRDPPHPPPRRPHRHSGIRRARRPPLRPSLPLLFPQHPAPNRRLSSPATPKPTATCPTP